MEKQEIYRIIREGNHISQLFLALPVTWQEHSRHVAKAAADLYGMVIRDNDLYEEETIPYTTAQVEQAVLYHDIGFLMIPGASVGDALYAAGRRLELVRQHTVYGAGMIEQYRLGRECGPGEEAVWRLAAEVAISHHEWWDGKGYPYGEMATAISLISRITAIVNYYDILHGRDGTKCGPRSPDSLEMLESQAGIQFDPRLVAKFITAYCSSDGFRGIFTAEERQRNQGGEGCGPKTGKEAG